MSAPPTPHYSDDDEIDLRELVRNLWQRRVLIISLAIVGAVLGFVLSTLSTRYVSSGLLLTPAVKTETYGQYAAALLSAPRFGAFLDRQQEKDPNTVALLRNLEANSGALAEAIKPQFSFTEQDAKKYGVKIEGSGTFIGFNLRNGQKEPSGGVPVMMLSEYVRDTLIEVGLSAVMLPRCLENEALEQKLRTEQLKDGFEITQNEARAQTLRNVIAQVPDSAVIDNRQIVTVDEKNERFLSPAAQLVGAEVAISELRLAQTERDRDRIAARLKRDYYCNANTRLGTSMSGAEFLNVLNEVHATVFKDQDMNVPIVAQTESELSFQRAGWKRDYVSLTRFVSPPEASEMRERKVGRATALLLGGMTGAMAGMFLALVLAWWFGVRPEPASK